MVQAFFERRLEQHVVGTRRGQPGTIGQLVFELAGTPTGVSQGEQKPVRPTLGSDQFQHFAAEGDPQSDAARARRGFAAVNPNVVRVQDEPLLGFHGTAGYHLARQVRRRGHLQLTQQIAERQVEGMVDDQALGAVFVVGPEIDQRIAEVAAAQLGHADQELPGVHSPPPQLDRLDGALVYKRRRWFALLVVEQT